MQREACQSVARRACSCQVCCAPVATAGAGCTWLETASNQADLHANIDSLAWLLNAPCLRPDSQELGVSHPIAFAAAAPQLNIPSNVCLPHRRRGSTLANRVRIN